MAAHQAPPSLGFSRQEHWSGLPFSSPMHESEKWRWSRSVVSDSSRPHGLQPTRLLCPLDFPGKSTGVGCQFLLQFLYMYMVLENVLISLFYMWLSSFPYTTYWRDCLFSIIYPCLLCGRLIDHKYMGLGAFCPIPLVCKSVFVPVPYYFDYCQFVV